MGGGDVALACPYHNLVPDWPTIAESGLPGYEASVWYGVMAPAKTDRAIVARLHREIVSILQQPEVRQSFTAQGTEVWSMVHV